MVMTLNKQMKETSKWNNPLISRTVQLQEQQQIITCNNFIQYKLLTAYSLAVRSSGSFGLLNFGHLFFPLYYLLLSPCNLYLSKILLHIVLITFPWYFTTIFQLASIIRLLNNKILYWDEVVSLMLQLPAWRSRISLFFGSSPSTSPAWDALSVDMLPLA